MKCRYCLNEVHWLVLIPESPETADITQSAFACEPCAIKHDIICPKHDRAHQAFSRGRNGCLLCIGEARGKLEPYFDNVVVLARLLIEQLDPELREQLLTEGVSKLELESILERQMPTVEDALFELIVRLIVLHRLNVDEFIAKYLTSQTRPESPLTLFARSPV